MVLCYIFLTRKRERRIIISSSDGRGFTTPKKWFTMSDMQTQQRGFVNNLLMPFVFVFLLFIVAAIFAVWAYKGREDYKDNATQKIAVAVTAATAQQKTQDAQQYALASQNPLLTYNGPQEFGSIVLQYPKTWSGYVAEADSSSTPIDGYFQPGVIPNIQTQTSSFALRVQILTESYDQAVTQYTSQAQQGQATITPFAFKKVPSNIGIMVVGTVGQNNQTGEEVIVPLRNQTIELWTESSQEEATFNNVILPNFSFSP